MKNKKNVFNQRRNKDLIFCLLVILIPAIQFGIFYIGVNFNSIAMAFQKFEIDSQTGKGAFEGNGFNNFIAMFNELRYDKAIGTAFKNSGLAFIVSVGVGTTLALVFSLYIYKEMFASKTFRVFLFLPSILSSTITVTMYRNFVETALPEIFPGVFNGMGLLSNPDTKMFAILFFMIWIGFGTQILMYSGAMNTIEQSVIEASKLDGTNSIQEFVHIILPLIYPTITTFLITSIAGLFTNQLSLYSFYGNSADEAYRTIGYHLFRQVNTGTRAERPLLAAYSVTLTLIATPITLLARWAFEKLGPKTE